MPIVRSKSELVAAITDKSSQFMEIWVERDDLSMAALINGSSGWLMLLNPDTQASWISVNPNYSGPDEATIEYLLDNGQSDECPASWAIGVPALHAALRLFMETGERDPAITWKTGVR